MLEKSYINILEKTLQELDKGFNHLPKFENQNLQDDYSPILAEIAQKLQNNYPYFHPLYAGQMLKPAHPIAQIAYMLAMWLNPNNHAFEGGMASTEMEIIAVKNIATMFGWSNHLGHLTSGGTIANLEALFVSGKIHPKKIIVANENAHYTHERISQVLKLKFKKIKAALNGEIDIDNLEKLCKKGNVGTVVVTMGTTGAGVVDPLITILQLQKKYEFRIHIDAAYGGFFILSNEISEKTKEQFKAIHKADSIVIDPHKHGLQPYGCGCIIFKDNHVLKYYGHDSSFTYFNEKETHIGEFSLECSRPGASAVALYATQQLLPYVKNGQFSKILDKCVLAANNFYELINNSTSFEGYQKPVLDIVIYFPRAKTTSKISKFTQLIFDLASEHNIHLALIKMDSNLFVKKFKHVKKNSATVTCLRSVFMKPEHIAWVSNIFKSLDTLYKENCLKK